MTSDSNSLPLMIGFFILVFLAFAMRRSLGNFIWFLSGGGFSGIYYYFLGILCCITIILYPAGKQLLKFGRLCTLPFGMEVKLNPWKGFFTTLGNIIWAIFFGWELFIAHLFLALICYITIIGIPFGNQHWKLMKLCLFPFGADVSAVKSDWSGTATYWNMSAREEVYSGWCIRCMVHGAWCTS